MKPFISQYYYDMSTNPILIEYVTKLKLSKMSDQRYKNGAQWR